MTIFTKQERAFRILLKSTGLLMLLLPIAILITLLIESFSSIKHFGFSFLSNTTWDPVSITFGAVPFVVGTLITSAIAITIATPFSLSIAIFTGEYYRSGFISNLVRSMIELLAGIPSVIYGFWAIFFLIPIMQTIETKFGLLPDGVGILTASLILSIMIIPYSASIAREVLSMIPSEQKEAAYALGATPYETLRHILIPYARSGISAGIILALGRALGETMAVTMVIGNRNSLPQDIIINQEGLLGQMSNMSHGLGILLSKSVPIIISLFSSANTMASVIANEFTEATNDIYVSSLVEIGLLLFIISMFINLIGKEIINRLGRDFNR